ncbi:hypothetical protein V8C35DRAFT_203251 [Trichoderma chlorosporum]
MASRMRAQAAGTVILLTGMGLVSFGLWLLASSLCSTPASPGFACASLQQQQASTAAAQYEAQAQAQAQEWPAGSGQPKGHQDLHHQMLNAAIWDWGSKGVRGLPRLGPGSGTRVMGYRLCGDGAGAQSRQSNPWPEHRALETGGFGAFWRYAPYWMV